MRNQFALIGLLILAVAIPAAPAIAVDSPEGTINIFTSRIDDFVLPDKAFEAGIDVSLSGFDNVSSVAVTIGSSDPLMLTEDEEEPGTWFYEDTFANFSDLKTALHGDWTVDISGSTNSVSTFTVNTDLVADPLEESDYLATPTDVSPASGAVDVPADVVFTWTAPSGGSAATALEVEVEDGNGLVFQEAISLPELDGSIDITDESWNPPADLAPGFNEFSVLYINFGNPDLLSEISVDPNGGPMTWLNLLDELLDDPTLWPDNKALFSVESATFVGFDVVIPEPASGVLLSTVMLCAFYRRRRNEG